MKNNDVAHAYNTFEFSFEKNFDNQSARRWMIEHWADSIFYGVIYLAVIFGLQHLMKKRPALKLDRLLAVWNLFLAIFSILATYRTGPEFLNILNNHGFYESVCNPSIVSTNKVTRIWIFLVVISKLAEFVDTLFIVLRKRPLTFLHVYHHFIAVVYTWFSYKESSSLIGWFMVMNLFVHSLMYTYYALSAMKFKPPKTVAIIITLLQIIQMIVGFLISMSAYIFTQSSYNCHVTRTCIIFGFIMYGSFIFLFVRFFIIAYFPDKQSKKNIKMSKKSD